MRRSPRSIKYKRARYENRSYLHHLEDLILLIKCLYPHREAVNPYEELIESQSWERSSKSLAHRLIKTLAILNQKYREEDSWCRFHACNEDLGTTLFLMERGLAAKKPKVLLNPAERNLYTHLFTKYGEQPFSCRQVMQTYHIAKSTANWKLRELISKGFVKVSHKEGQKYLYVIIRPPYKT